MSVEDLLRRRAESTRPRGAGAVFAAARDEVRVRSPRRTRSVSAVALAAAAAVAVVVGIAAVTGEEEHVIDAGPPPADEGPRVPGNGGTSTTATTDAQHGTARLPRAIVAHMAGGGLVRVETDGSWKPVGVVVPGAHRAGVAVDAGTGAMFSVSAGGGCDARLVRIDPRSSGSGADAGSWDHRVISPGAATAPAWNGVDLLASVEPAGCGTEWGRVVVADRDGGRRRTLDLNADAGGDGLAMRPVDVVWTSPERVAVLADAVDGVPVSQIVVEYEVTEDDLVFSGRQAFSGAGPTWTAIAPLDGESFAVASGPPLDGGRGPTSILEVQLPADDDEPGSDATVVGTLVEVDGPVSELLVDGDAVVYTVPGRQPSEDAIHVARAGGPAERLVRGMNGIAWAAP